MSVRVPSVVSGLVLATLVGCVVPAEVAAPPPPGAQTPEEEGSPATPDAPESDDLDGAVAVQGCEPRSLIPSGVSSACGQRVVQALFAQLVEYTPPDWRPRWGPEAPDAVAERITSPDARRWLIRLKEGWTFHDGEPVTARSFAAAWNQAAFGPNAQPTAALFSPIEGFDELRCSDAACDPAGLPETLAGVRVLGEHTLAVTLAEPRRSFPARLGHPAFSPLPDGTFEEPEAYAEAPVGNGPFRMDGRWEHDRFVRLRRFEDYPGRRAASEAVEFRLLDTPQAAWEALLDGSLDIVDELPRERIDEARQRAPDRFLQRAGTHYSFLVLPSGLEWLRDERVARALSLALDRRRIIQEQLGGGAAPAGSLVAPALRGGGRDPCGADCRHDPAEARRLLAAAGGLPDEGLTLLYPRGADYEPSLRAVARQWTRSLRLSPERIRLRALALPAFLAHIEDHPGQGSYRLGWPMDVPSPRNYLQPLHGPGGLFNLDGYHNPLVDRLLRSADRADDPATSLSLYREAERVVLRDWHHIPLWFDYHQAVHSERVTEVSLGPFGHVRLSRVTPGPDPARSPGGTGGEAQGTRTP